MSVNQSTREAAAVLLLRIARAVAKDHYVNPPTLAAIGHALLPLYQNCDGAESSTARRLVTLEALSGTSELAAERELQIVSKVQATELAVLGLSPDKPGTVAELPDGLYVYTTPGVDGNMVQVLTLADGRRGWRYFGESRVHLDAAAPTNDMTRLVRVTGLTLMLGNNTSEQTKMRVGAKAAISGVLEAINEFQDGDAATLAVIADSFYEAAQACAAMLDSHRDACLSPRVRHLRDQLKLVRIVD